MDSRSRAELTIETLSAMTHSTRRILRIEFGALQISLTAVVAAESALRVVTPFCKERARGVQKEQL